MSLFVLRVVLHALHLVLIVLLVLAVLHGLVVGQRAAIEVRLVHLHWVDLSEVAAAGQNVHVHHRAPTAVRWCASVRHASKTALPMDPHPETLTHRTHLLVKVHHMQRITHLLLKHNVIGLVVVHHVVDGHLALSPALLRSHWHMVRLVHRVLVRTLPRLVFSRVLRFLVRILHYLVHLDFVPDRRRRLRILDVVHVLVDHLGLHVIAASHLVVVDVVFAAP